MPTYDYHCAKCRKTYETREGFEAPTSHRCQECGKGTAKRVLSAPRIVFKGTGWYATDSRSKTVASSEPGESTGSESKSDAGTSTPVPSETKPAKQESKAAATSSDSGSESP